jgi:hypothetical protein
MKSAGKRSKNCLQNQDALHIRATYSRLQAFRHRFISVLMAS